MCLNSMQHRAMCVCVGKHDAPFLQVSAVCEWVMAICLILFFASYYGDFSRITFELHIVSPYKAPNAAVMADHHRVAPLELRQITDAANEML